MHDFKSWIEKSCAPFRGIITSLGAAAKQKTQQASQHLNTTNAGTDENQSPPCAYNKFSALKAYLSEHDRVRMGLWIFLLLLLIVAPIKMGPVTDDRGPNARFPVIGQIESLCAHESGRILSTAGKAYLLSKTVTQSLSLLRNVQVSAGFVSVNPGSVLSGAIDSIERVANALFIVMAVMLVEKFSIGIFFWFCFKVLLVAALILRIVYEIRPYRLAQSVGGFCTRLAIALMLFIPLMFYITGKIDTAYKPSVQKSMEEVNQMQAEAGTEKYLEDVKDGKEQPSGGWKKFIPDKLSGWISNLDPNVIKNKAEALQKAAEKQTEKLFNLFAAFTLSVVVIPILMIAILWKVLLLLGTGLKSSYKAAIEEQKQLPEGTSN